MKEGNVDGLFQTPFFIGEIDYEYEIPKNEKFVDGHNRKGVVSPNVLNLDLECANHLIVEVGFVEQPMKINQLWLNVYDETRAGLPVHWHQNCSWSGTFFPEDSHHTTFYVNPNAGYQNMNFPEFEKPTDFNQDYTPFRGMPKGAVIIHPSWIGHSVIWHGDEPSYSISFDIAYTGEIGSKEYGSYNDGQ